MMIFGRCAEHGHFRYDIDDPSTQLVTDPPCPECLQRKESSHNAAIKKSYEQKAWETLRRRIEAAGIPRRYQGKTLETFNDDLKATQKAKAFADFLISEGIEDGVSGLIVGGVGTGKTHLAAALCIAVLKKGLSARYALANNIFDDINSVYRGVNSTARDIAKKYTEPKLLVIDEVGAQSGTQHEQNTIFNIINDRYNSLLSTVLVSNLAAREIRSLLGERVIDRIKSDGGRLVVLDGESRRR